MVKYCFPIIAKSKAELQSQLHLNQGNYDFFEIWLDYIADLDTDLIVNLSTSLQDKLLFLFRRKQLEPIQMSLERRNEIIELLSKSNSWLDLDISQMEDLNSLIALNSRPKLICSFHNYSVTPELPELRRLLESMQAFNPRICKFACKCNNKADALRLLTFQAELTTGNYKHIVLGMGKDGLITRIFATLWGNQMLFVANDKANTTAPGQTTKAEMENIFSAIKACNKN